MNSVEELKEILSKDFGSNVIISKEKTFTIFSIEYQGNESSKEHVDFLDKITNYNRKIPKNFHVRPIR